MTATMTETVPETQDPSQAVRPTPHEAWHERHPTIGLVLLMVFFAIGGLAVSALVILGATLAVALT